MKMIVIKESIFDNLFQQALDKLKLERFTNNEESAKFANSPIGQMHRAFHYEICKLKDKLKEE